MEKYFLVKIKVETLTEKGKVKKVTEQYLVEAEDIKSAEKDFCKQYEIISTYEIASISETKILDVFNFVAPKEKEKENEKLKNSQDSEFLSGSEQNHDPLLRSAALMIIEQCNVSVSAIQRKFSLGYNRAGRIMSQLENTGVVGSFNGSEIREVLVSIEQFESMGI